MKPCQQHQKNQTKLPATDVMMDSYKLSGVPGAIANSAQQGERITESQQIQLINKAFQFLEKLS